MKASRPTTTARRRRLGAAIIAFVTAIPVLEAQLPVSGRPVPGMTAFDTIITDFMKSNGVTAGVLAISRAGRIEYLRGFGLNWTKLLPTQFPNSALNTGMEESESGLAH
jgi:hypothetical protein